MEGGRECIRFIFVIFACFSLLIRLCHCSVDLYFHIPVKLTFPFPVFVYTSIRLLNVNDTEESAFLYFYPSICLSYFSCGPSFIGFQGVLEAYLSGSISDTLFVQQTDRNNAASSCCMTKSRQRNAIKICKIMLL